MKPDELQQLIAAWLDGRLTEEESAALQTELRQSEAAREEFRRWTQLDAALRERTGADSFATNPADNIISPPPQKTWQQAAGWLTAAAAIILLFVLWPQEVPVQTEATSSGCATLSRTLGAEFKGTTIHSGDMLVPGTIQLEKGLAQLEFFSGAMVWVEGAATIEIVSAWEANCLAGRVRVHVPPAAKGFKLNAPGLKLEDLGTEFGLNVDATAKTSAVHVFDGEVIAQPLNGTRASLTKGMGLQQNDSVTTTEPIAPESFLSIRGLQGQIREHQAGRYREWGTWAQQSRQDPRLAAYYDFEIRAEDRWKRLIPNLAQPQNANRAGGAVGARWTEGRWPEKGALEFKRPGDRVRINLDGSYQAITLSCWVKVDAVDKKYNSLLLTDGYDPGEPHWQIFEDGSLMFSISYFPPSTPKPARGKNNQMYFSRPVFTADNLGRWHHLAATYDNMSGEVVQYFDGAEAGREVSKLHQPGRPIVFGPCEIGNWGLPTENHKFPVRNLNGAIDELAVYQAVLSAPAIHEMFEKGKPE